MPCRSYPNLVAWTVVQTGRVCPKVEGPPGCGKSASIAAFARSCGQYMHTLVGSLLQPTDFAVPFPDAENPGRLKMISADWAHIFNTLEGGMLFLEELTQCAPAQQTPIMRIIQEGRVGDTDLPPRLWKIAACNPPECAANGSELEPPLANRICHLTWETDYEGWERAMANGAAFAPPQFYPLPDTWEQHLPKYSALVAAFHKHLPGRLEKYPSERSKVSGPWPSMRSWTNGAICMAALAAIDAEPALRYRALAGCVGDDVALEYQTWESNLDLPDPEGWLALAVDARSQRVPLTPSLEIPNRGDKVMAVLAGVVDRVKNHSLDAGTGKIAEPRWLAGIDCCVAVAGHWREPAMMAAASLYGVAPNPGMFMKVPGDFAAECAELLGNIRNAS